MATRVIDDNKLNNIATAIQAKDSGGQMTVDEMPNRIEALNVVKPEVEEKDVNFYDYDGTLLYSYTFSEATQLLELPEMPEHKGLTAQEWNWTLSDIAEQVGEGYELDAGVSYITTDGHTKIFMRLISPYFLNPTISFTINGNLSLTIDWGDGTTPDVISSSTNLSHNWQFTQFPCDVLIDIAPDDGGGNFYFANNNSSLFDSGVDANYYKSCVEKIYIGGKVIAARRGNFSGLTNLKIITIPNTIQDWSYSHGIVRDNASLKFLCLPRGITHAKDYAFSHLYSLKIISVPITLLTLYADGINYSICEHYYASYKGAAICGRAGFDHCYFMNKFNFPKYVTAIQYGEFQNTNIQSINIPKQITKIGPSSFYDCVYLYLIDLSDYDDPNNIPTLDNVNAFRNTPANKVLLVRNQEMLDAFTQATNWSTYADRF